MTWISRPTPIATATVTFSTTTGNVDAVVFTIPSSPSGSARFILSRILVRTTGIGGSDTGTVGITVGTTTGGNDIITSQTINNATTTSVIAGLSIATLGTAMTAANGYELVMAAGDTVNLRAATTGTVSASKTATAYVYGYYLP